MIKFTKKIFYFILLSFLFLEIFCRIAVDPLYYYKTNRYSHPSELITNSNEMLQDIELAYESYQLPTVDYLFLGSSRMWCAIKASVFSNEETTSISINAADGNITPAIEYFALEKSFTNNLSSFSKTTFVFEYPRDLIYFVDSSDFKFQVLEESPHKIVPYLNCQQLIEFVMYSNNSISAKINVLFSSISSAYRTYPFIREYQSKFIKKIINRVANIKETRLLASGGGIKQVFTEEFKEGILEGFKQKKESFEKMEILSETDFDCSMIAKIIKMIKSYTKDKGKIVFLNIPLYSKDKEAYNCEIIQRNLAAFKRWAVGKNIKIIMSKNFKYSDNDFPDNLHLNRALRNEYSKYIREVIDSKNINISNCYELGSAK